MDFPGSSTETFSGINSTIRLHMELRSNICRAESFGPKSKGNAASILVGYHLQRSILLPDRMPEPL